MKKLASNKYALNFLLLLVLVVAAFLRLWRLPNTLQFLADQGRDATVVARIFTDLDPVFIGPVTSIGNMYLGPFYYYFMLPWLFLTYPSPLGPAYAVAIVGIITVYLTYALGKQMFGWQPALMASGLLATNFVAIEFNRFSWNPNIAPLFGLLILWTVWKAKNKPAYWLVFGLLAGLIIQLHYIALLAVAAGGLVYLANGISIWKIHKFNNNKIREWLLAGLGAGCIFLLTLTPLLLFDIKHNFLNLRGFANMFGSSQAFVGESQSGVASKLLQAIKESHGRSMHVFFEINSWQNRSINTFLVLATVIFWVWQVKTASNKQKYALQLLGFFLAITIVGLSFYQHTVFNHYITFVLPIVFLTYGIVLTAISKFRYGWLAVIAFSYVYLLSNISRYPFTTITPSIYDMQLVSDSIYAKVNETELYDIVLYTGTGDADGLNYRYFLNTKANPPATLENRASADKLFIIDELNDGQNVLALPTYEIVTFPNKVPNEVYSLENGTKVTVLSR